MAKSQIIYVCSACGNEAKTKTGKCLACGEFGTLESRTVETVVEQAATAGLKSSGSIRPSSPAKTLKELDRKPIKRFRTGISELDRVLGGGFVEAEVVLFAGFPGAGKSTLSLNVANKFAEDGQIVLYSSGEESESQIALRARRMGIENDLIKITNETNLETLMGHIAQEKPSFLIVDSLQTIASTAIDGSIGGLSQSREAAHLLTRLAKKANISMILISQVVKGGDFAGSEAIQHIVDCSLVLESDVDTPFKILRAGKNRFGDTSEIGVFQHTERGLEEVTDPAGILIDAQDGNSAGAACSFVSEGVRQLPIEVQALVAKTTAANPRRQFSGVNFNRGQIVCAILDKHLSAKLYEKDVFLSTISGVRVNDPQADLSIAAAILSSANEKVLTDKTMFVGELTLTGSVRGLFMLESKIREAERLGFDRIVVPANGYKQISRKYSVQIDAIDSVEDLKKYLQ